LPYGVKTEFPLREPEVLASLKQVENGAAFLVISTSTSKFGPLACSGSYETVGSISFNDLLDFFSHKVNSSINISGFEVLSLFRDIHKNFPNIF
jgi:hypothetical protein